MNTSGYAAKSASHKDGQIVLVMESCSEMQFPVAANARLSKGTPAQLNNIRLSPFGLHWPELDEDLSLKGIVEGNYGR